MRRGEKRVMVHSADGHRTRKGGNSGAPPDLYTTALASHSTCAVKGAVFSPVKVRPGELSVHPSSYRGGEEGDRIAEALGTLAHQGWVCKLTGRNASEA
jgi:hypothetical protein